MADTPILLDDDTDNDTWFDPQYSRGAEPRDYAVDPPEMFAPPNDIPMIDRAEWDARIKEQEETQSSLEHLWLRGDGGRPVMPLDQNGYPLCWGHSTVHSVMATRVRDNAPLVALSAVGLCMKITGFVQKGGWCGLSAKFARDIGIPTQADFPQDAPARKYDTAATWENAAKFKITADYVDLTVPHYYYQKLTFDQVASCLLQNIPCPVDFNFWSHSVTAMRLIRVEAGSYGLRILNSWYKGQGVPWGENGFATMRGQKAIPDSAVATRAVLAS